MFRALTTASASAPVLPEPSPWRTACGHQPDRMSGFWCSRYSAATPASPRCCPRWQVQPIVASFPKQIRYRAADGIAGVGPLQESQPVFCSSGLRRGDVRRRRDGLRARNHRCIRTQETRRHRRHGLRKAQGTLPNYNGGKSIDVVNQKLGYLVRCGDPDAIDSIVPMAYGNLALDLLLSKVHGRLVVLKKTPRAIAAKVTRVVKRPRRGKSGGGYAIHYVFLAADGLGYTGIWYAQNWDGRNYAPGMLVPVLYDGLNPGRNSA